MYNAYTSKAGAFVTPSDTLTIAQQFEAAGKGGQLTPRVWVGSAGNLTVTMESGDILTFSGVPQGMLELRVIQVWATQAAAQASATAAGQPTAGIGATTCANILALY